MRMFSIPFELESEDKIFGGILSLRQLFWLMIPVFTIIYFFMVNRNYVIMENGEMAGFDEVTIFIRVSISLLTVVMGVVFAFIKFNGLYGDKYTLRMIKYFFRKKLIKYKRK